MGIAVAYMTLAIEFIKANGGLDHADAIAYFELQKYKGNEQMKATTEWNAAIDRLTNGIKAYNYHMKNLRKRIQSGSSSGKTCEQRRYIRTLCFEC